MKKTISLILSATILLCCICFSGCNNQVKQVDTKEIKVEDIEKALIEAGYSEANFQRELKKWEVVYLDNSKTDCISENNLPGDYLPAFFFKKSRDDIPKISDAVMPLYDKEYKQGDGEKIMERLISDRFFSDDYTHGGRISFNNYEYEEFLDETDSFTDCIMVKKSET